MLDKGVQHYDYPNITMTTLFERFSSRDNPKLAYKYVQNKLAHANLSVIPINHRALTAINALGDQFFAALEQYLRDDKYVPERGFLFHTGNLVR